MRLLVALVTVAAIAAFLLGLLAWIWLGEPRHVATGVVAAIVLSLLAAALAGEGKRRDIRR